MSKNRLEAFSDGVIAIIITIMVLELTLPLGDTFQDFFADGVKLLTYALSYFFIAIYWVNHHLTFDHVERVNLKILWCNLIWLFVMSLIPFTTAWVGKYPTSWAPITIYFADMTLACIAFHVMYYFIARENNVKFRLNVRSLASLITYTAAAGLGGFCPIVAFIVVASVSLWWVVPLKGWGARIIERDNKPNDIDANDSPEE